MPATYGVSGEVHVQSHKSHSLGIGKMFCKLRHAIRSTISSSDHSSTKSLKSNITPTEPPKKGVEVQRTSLLCEGTLARIPVSSSDTTKEAWGSESKPSSDKHLLEADRLEAEEYWKTSQLITKKALGLAPGQYSVTDESESDMETKSLSSCRTISINSAIASPRVSIDSVSSNDTSTKDSNRVRPSSRQRSDIQGPEDYLNGLAYIKPTTILTKQSISTVSLADSAIASSVGSSRRESTQSEIPSSPVRRYSILSGSEFDLRLQTEHSEVCSSPRYTKSAQDFFEAAKFISYSEAKREEILTAATKARDDVRAELLSKYASYTEDDRIAFFKKAIEAAEHGAALGSTPAANLLLVIHREGIKHSNDPSQYLIKPSPHKISALWFLVTSKLKLVVSEAKVLTDPEYTPESTKSDTAPHIKMARFMELSRLLNGQGLHEVGKIQEWLDAFTTIKNDDISLPTAVRPNIPEFVWQRKASFKLKDANTYS